MTSNDKVLSKVVASVGDLPSMPKVVGHVLALTDDPNVAISEMSEAIEQDPALTAKLLRISNSPYFGMKQTVGSLKLALVILGVREVRNIVLGISVIDSLRSESTEGLLNEGGFWRHSVLVGGFARNLGNKIGLGLQGEDFIAGLLHDIGKMVLWREKGRRYSDMYDQSGGHSRELCALELEEYGFDHTDVGAVLCEKWNLPETLKDAIRFHHPNEERPLETARDPQISALVRIANAAAKEDWGGETVPAPCCQDDESWDILGSRDGIGTPQERHDLLAAFHEDLEKTPIPSL